MFPFGALSAFAAYLRGVETYLLVNSILAAIVVPILFGAYIGLIDFFFESPGTKSKPPQ